MFNVVYFEPRAVTIVGSNPDRDFGFIHMKEGMKLAYGQSVILLSCSHVPEIMRAQVKAEEVVI